MALRQLRPYAPRPAKNQGLLAASGGSKSRRSEAEAKPVFNAGFAQ